MRFASFRLLPYLLVLLYIPLNAQQTPTSSAPVAADPQAVKLLRATFSTLMAGSASVPSTIVASGTATPALSGSQPPYSVRIFVEGTNKFRWEEDLTEGTTTTVVNGQNAQSQLGSTTTPLAPWEIGGKKLENFPMLLISMWLNSSNAQLQFVALETVDGQSLNHISITDLSQRSPFPNPWHRDGSRGKYELYLDPTTGYPVRLHFYQDTSDTSLHSLMPVDIVFSDYRLTGGAVFPFAWTRYLNGVKTSSFQLQTLELNGAVSVQQFQIE